VLKLGEHLLDWVQVEAVRRQEDEPGADGPDGSASTSRGVRCTAGIVTITGAGRSKGIGRDWWDQGLGRGSRQRAWARWCDRGIGAPSRATLMWCIGCGSQAITARPEHTAPGYRRFRCRAGGKQFNERTGTAPNRAQCPSDLIALVVLWRLRDKLRVRDSPEMFALRGMGFSQPAVREWEAKLTPALDSKKRSVRAQSVSMLNGRSCSVESGYALLVDTTDCTDGHGFDAGPSCRRRAGHCPDQRPPERWRFDACERRCPADWQGTLGEKWKDEQRIDNCKVPLDKRGTRPRPDSCAHVPSG
jgi:hypothetical protein